MKAHSGPTALSFRIIAGLMIALVLMAALPASPVSAAPTVVTFTTSGSWVAPAGVTSVTVEVWGGGGRGGTRTSSGGSGRGGGGGGGAYSIKLDIPVVPGNSYAYVVGAGSTTTAAGGDSYFINAATVMAKGGSSVPDNNTTGALGGAALSGVGDTKYSGGNGANAGTSYGGGGGSSAGTAAVGVNATNQNGAVAPSGGGNGGNGRANSSGGGTDGSTPGGGGGGAYRGGFGTQYGGDGARGQVRLTFTLPPTTTIGDGTSPSAKFAKGSETDLAVSAFTLSATADDTVTALTVTGSGTGLTNVSAVKLWKDNGTANEWDGADVSMGSASFIGNAADFSGLSIPVTATPTQYLVTFDVVASPVNGETAQAAVSSITGTNPVVVNNDNNDAVLTIDTVAPTTTLGSPSKTITNIGPVTFTVTYADTNFNSSTLVPANVTLNATGDAAGSVAVTGTGSTRTVTISGITGNGTLGVSIAAGTATDKAGNPAPGAGPSETFIVDNVVPTVLSIDRLDPDPSVAATVNWTVNFSKPVLNVGTNDFALVVTGGISGQAITGVTGSGAGPYTVTASTGSGSGTLGLNIALTPTIQDSAGNAVATGFVGQVYTFNRNLIISGTLTAVGANATVTCLATVGTCPASVVADGTGFYTFTVVGSGTPTAFSGTIEPVPPSGYTFSPPTRTYTLITSDQLSQNYTPHVVTHTTFYVDNTNPACSPTGGTLAVPYCTISQAANVAVAGNTVRVLAGTYAETVKPKFGNPDDPVTFIAGPGVVTVTGEAGNFTNGGAFRMSLKHDIIIDGFTVTNTADYGIIAYKSTRLTVRNNHVSYSGSTTNTRVGIEFDAVTNSTISGNTTDHNTYHGIRVWDNSSGNTVSNNISFGNATQTNSRATGIDFEASSINNVVIHNIAYANEDSGLNFYGGSSGNTVVGNLSYGNGDHGIDNNGSPNNVIIGNTVQGNVTSGINLEGLTAPGSGGGTVRNNIVMDNGLLRLVGGGHLAVPPANIRVDSNSLVGTNIDYNLYYLSPGLPETPVQVVWDGSSYASLLAFQSAHPTQEVHGLSGNPLLEAPAPVAQRPTAPSYAVAINLGDYHIQNTSPAIDSASSAAPEPVLDIEGFARVDDPSVVDSGAPSPLTYYDRGAYEYQPVITTLVSNNNPSTYGQDVQFTATVNKSDATGTVNFYDGAALIGSGTLSGGTPNTAVFSTGDLATSVLPHSITAVYLGDTTYDFTSTSAALLQVVNPKAITITPDSGQTKIYGDLDPVFTYTASPALEVGDSFTGALGRDEGEAVGTYAFTLDTLTAGPNYTLTVAPGRTFSITPKPITITPDSGQTKVYGAVDPVFTYTPSETPDVPFTGALGRVAGVNVGTYAFTLNTLSAGANYTLSLAPGQTFAITAKDITITPTAGQSKVYGALDPVFTFTPAPALEAGDSFTGALGRDPGTDVGNYAFTLNTLSAGTNYILSLAPGQTFAITAKPITITPDSGQTKVYGDLDPVFTYTASETPDVAFTGALGRDPGTDVGAYAFTLGDLSAGTNYTLSLAAGRTFAITAKPITITPNVGQSKVFGQVDPVFTFVATPDLEAGDSFTGAIGRGAGENVGSYAFTLGDLSGGINYTLSLAAGRTFAITPKPITVTVTPGQTKVFGTSDPVFAYTSSDLAAVFTGALVRDAGEDVGSYAITQGDLSAGANYAITFVGANFSITKASQAITFDPLSNRTLGSADFTVTAEASSTLPVSFTGITPLVCDVSVGGLVHLKTLGTCTINANQAGNGNYNAAPQVQRSFDVVLNETFTVLTTSGSPSIYGQSVTFTATVTLGAIGNVDFYDGTEVIGSAALNNGTPNQAVLVISDLNVADSPHAITAHYLGDANHGGSVSSIINQLVNRAPLSITAKDDSKVYDGIAYSGGNGLTYTGFVNSETELDLAGTPLFGGTSQGAVNVGPYTITVSGLTSENYLITFLPGTLTITKAPQTITFTSTVPAFAGIGTNYTPTAEATSGLAVVITIDPSSALICSMSSGVVTFNTVGDCIINANQSGNGNYESAPQKQQIIGVGKFSQTITFTSTPPAAPKPGDTYAPAATASSGLTVSITVDSGSETVCSISSGLVTFDAVGTCTLNADQPGNGTYSPAPQVQQSIVVAMADQTITFTSTPPVDAKPGGTYSPTAEASSGLPVTLTIDDSSASVCSISGGVVTFNGVGTCKINANQSGNGSYNPAPQAQQTIIVSYFKVLLPLIFRQ